MVTPDRPALTEALTAWLDEAWSVTGRARLEQLARSRATRGGTGPDSGRSVIVLDGLRVDLTHPGATIPVHLGYDTLWLLELAMTVEPRERAIELGAGSGLIAAALGRRWKTVVATELTGQMAELARRTSDLNGGSMAVVRTDVAAGLRRGSFDLVVGNPPYLPDLLNTDRPWADGGPTGAEVPGRFAHAAAAAIRPGGTAFVLFADTRWADGRRPLAEIVERIGTTGTRIDVVEPPASHRVRGYGFSSWKSRVPDLAGADLVALRMTR